MSPAACAIPAICKGKSCAPRIKKPVSDICRTTGNVNLMNLICCRKKKAEEKNIKDIAEKVCARNMIEIRQENGAEDKQ
jgi:hypothetical protein